MNITKSL